MSTISDKITRPNGELITDAEARVQDMFHRCRLLLAIAFGVAVGIACTNVAAGFAAWAAATLYALRGL